MQGRPGAGDLWGKFRDESRGGPAWHPLIDHCTDVACVLEALLHQPTIRRRLARAGGLDDLDEVQAARLCFLAFIHDLGKCNWGFQRKILPEVTERAGHVSEVGALLLDERLSRAFEAILPVADMADWMEDEGLLPLFIAVISHHRRQLRVTDGNMAIPCNSSFRRLWEPAHGRRPLNDVRSVIAAACSTFARSFETGGARIPSTAAFQHAFCGLLMLADWIGSDERGFPFREPDDPPREACARAWAADALARIGLAVEHGRAAVHDAAVGDAAANGFPLNTVQRAVADLPLDPPPQLVVLEAETGSGKTEAALLHFKRLFEAGLVDGLYFALPTRSSASQIQNRVVAWTKRLFPAADRPRVVLALPVLIGVEEGPRCGVGPSGRTGRASGLTGMPGLRRMKAHAKTARSHSVAFKRQVAEEYLAGETLHGLAKRHDLSRNLIRVWVAKYEAGAFDDDAGAADLIQAYEARIAALERLVGKQALELEFLKGAARSAPLPRSAPTSVIIGPAASPSPKDAG